MGQFVSFSLTFCLLIFVSGVSSIKPNNARDKDDRPQRPAKDNWIQLVNKVDGVLSLKPWGEVEANSDCLSKALCERMRQAWSEYFIILIIASYILSLAI